MNNLYLGIDTSNYTTSVAIAGDDNRIYFDERKLLQVKQNNCGLRQSEAVFQHISNLPELCGRIPEELIRRIKGVGYSKTPRPVEGSYMPVFRTGEGFAKSISKFLQVPLVATTHQENHIRSAWFGAGEPELNKLYAGLQFSGGTSEILKIENKDGVYDIQIIGETRDLNAGQFVDRVGVALGFSFPAGKEVEKCSMEAEKRNLVIPSTVSGYDFHFSGQETKAKQYIKDNESKSEICYAVLKCIAKTIEKVLIAIAEKDEIYEVLLAGGVMSNQLIKEQVENRLLPKGIKLYFSDIKYASDNAVGTALITKDQLITRSKKWEKQQKY
jgi:N6-L-threonylcarbamoyladenine synthase